MPDMNIDSDGFAAEVAAIGEVLASLSSLSGPARERVVDYVLKALSIRLTSAAAPPSTPHSVSQRTTAEAAAAAEPKAAAAISDIRTLKESKQPNSANQMAALAAYYLQDLAPESERSDVIDAAALDRLFRQANFPLPKRIAMTLPNATQAGYFDSTGETGKYRLNPVGYNLVVHNLPSGSEPARRRPAKKATAKKSPAKQKTSAKKAPAKKAPAKKA